MRNNEQPTTLAMLPGMDGTGRLFARFVRALPNTFRSVQIGYSADVPSSYEELETLVRNKIDGIDGPVILVAESFSGPIGIRIAAVPPANLRALVLVATFVLPPVSRLLRLIARPLFFRRPPPRAAIRHMLLGRGASDAVVDEVVEAIRVVAPAVMAHRARQILTVDVRESFSTIRLPVLFCAGQNDRLVKTRCETVLALNRAVAWAEIDAPHLVLQAAPRESAEAILGFLVAGGHL